ncbi:hypothetical protein BLA60_16030 [Actinophytocola xinjiangensis]|uniref:Uncharacterized protein n=1 Tax=Actinophytocola xinjiangensis TaxID=485602 RepID=A0A7Z0WN41_9PSEU|nr:hypothetical protein BLA60_16030 [Actinophytocola xinjiangensis]
MRQRRTVLLLISLFAGLLTLWVLVGVSGLLVFARVHEVSTAARTRTVNAISEIATARSALVRADQAAILSFTSGGGRLAGPGDEFQNQVAIASQSLTMVAEHTMTRNGSSTLRLVQGLVVTYVGMIGQADAHFRQPGGEALGAVDLWHASRLLHGQDATLLRELDGLLSAHQDVLADHLDEASTPWHAEASIILLAVALLALLAFTNLVYLRRFRRRVNPWLVVAAAALIGSTLLTWHLVGSDEGLSTTGTTLNGMVDQQRTLDDAASRVGQVELRDLVVGTVCGDQNQCGATLARFDEDVNAAQDPLPTVTESDVAEQALAVRAHADAAEVGTGSRTWLIALDALLVVAILLGTLPPLFRYRFRSR